MNKDHLISFIPLIVCIIIYISIYWYKSNTEEKKYNVVLYKDHAIVNGIKMERDSVYSFIKKDLFKNK